MRADSSRWSAVAIACAVLLTAGCSAGNGSLGCLTQDPESASVLSTAVAPTTSAVEVSGAPQVLGVCGTAEGLVRYVDQSGFASFEDPVTNPFAVSTAILGQLRAVTEQIAARDAACSGELGVYGPGPFSELCVVVDTDHRHVTFCEDANQVTVDVTQVGVRTGVSESDVDVAVALLSFAATHNQTEASRLRDRRAWGSLAELRCGAALPHTSIIITPAPALTRIWLGPC